MAAGAVLERGYRFALTIAGSDSGGGAGIQADLKAFAAAGAFGLSAITAITAQNSRAVSAVYPSGAAAVQAQLRAVAQDFPIHAVKTGMLVDAETIRCVHSELAAIDAPLVLDPVMIASSGAALLDAAAVHSYKPLIARATLLTPNLDEAAALLGVSKASSFNTKAQLVDAAQALLALGCGAVLLKGGHGQGTLCCDLLVQRANGRARWFQTKRLARRGHGTGCTLSALIAAFLARGQTVEVAVTSAIGMLRSAFRGAAPIGAAQVHTPDPFFRRYLAQ
jgi:hydroxymethylpyrimidine/phosphomethylpyrimidine kinase